MTIFLGYEYSIFLDRIPDEPHRTGFDSKEEAEEWIREAEEMGFRPGAFQVKRRKIMPWEDVPTGR